MREMLKSYLALFEGTISTGSHTEKCGSVICTKKQWEITSENLALEISTFGYIDRTLQEIKVSMNEDPGFEEEELNEKDFFALTRWSGFGFRDSDNFSLLSDTDEIKIEGHIPQGLKENDFVALPDWAIALHVFNVYEIGPNTNHPFIKRSVDGKETTISPGAAYVSSEEPPEFTIEVFNCNGYI